MRVVEWRSRLRMVLKDTRMLPVYADTLPLTINDVLLFLEILTFLLLVVLLFNLVFVALDLRRIIRRVNKVTTQLEQVVLKPINMADATVEWIAAFLEGYGKKNKKSTKK